VTGQGHHSFPPPPPIFPFTETLLVTGVVCFGGGGGLSGQEKCRRLQHRRSPLHANSRNESVFVPNFRRQLLEFRPSDLLLSCGAQIYPRRASDSNPSPEFSDPYEKERETFRERICRQEYAEVSYLYASI
jgi:hypothetical protein